MSYPYVNAINAQGVIRGFHATDGAGIVSGEFPLFDTSTPVDASGLEFASACMLDSTTAGTQTIASGATTVVLKPYDGATTAAAASDNNELFAVGDFSNSNTGANSWATPHSAAKATGTSTTDLDADDWVNLDVAGNVSGAGGFQVITWGAFYVHGVPGAVA